ncbi:hypothetical protein SAMN05216436_1355 [bacterium A37T11]|nr:hypothetical protein SAMN05216436_1355 [bacterium A37T11]
MIIDWNKLQPYKTSKSKSFEQLCYQIAFRLYSSQGNFTPVDDSGGGDGVEFYLTMPNGIEWGWQAKYYEGLARLNVSSRKAAIISSLKRAINKHPKLEIWYLCLAMDLTPEEEIWVNTELIKYIPSNHQAKIRVWNESFLHEKINQPIFNGLKHSFFNELELSDDWFDIIFQKSFSLVKNKFDSFLYTANEEFEYFYVNPLLCNEKFISHRIAYYPRKLSGLLEVGKKKLEKLRYANGTWRPVFNKYIEKYGEFNLVADRLISECGDRLDTITPNSVDKLSGQDFASEITMCRAIKAELDEFRRIWYQDNFDKNNKDQKRSHTEQFIKVSEIDQVYAEFIEELNNYVSHSSLPLKWRSAHFLGNGGDGKTNFAVALVKGYLNTGLPAIYLPAILLTGSTVLSVQILSLLDIKSGYTFGDLLDCLDEMGRIHNRRIPFILDGLNEATNAHGFFNERLKLDLPQLEVEFSLRKNLVLITTCRTSYKEEIWETDKFDDSRFHFLYGFTNHEDKKKLVRNYFRHYKIQADLSFISLERFTKPLYLKLYCESVNSPREKVKQVTLGFNSIYSIFEDFVTLCDANIFKRIKMFGKLSPNPVNKRQASRVCTCIGEWLWNNNQRPISLNDLMFMADGKIVDNYNNSITKALLDEELLFVRNFKDGKEFVYLTYDLLAGYFIAKHLIETVADFSAFFNSNDFGLLMSQDYEELHSNHEDIIDALCSLLPLKKGIFVHDLLGREREKMSPVHSRLFGKSIGATIMQSPEHIPAQQVAYVGKLANNPRIFVRLLSLSEGVLFVSNHSFNFRFWSSRLENMSMNERDSTWSEYLRNQLPDGFLDDQILEFEVLQLVLPLTQEQEEKILLVAAYLKWTFTSTSLSIKQKAGDALFAFAVRFTTFFLKEYYHSAKLNDPTVFEWMSGVMYTATIFIVKKNLSNHKSDMVKLAKFLYEEVFNPDGDYASNHMIIRNYAFNSLKLLVRSIPEVASIIDLKITIENFKHVGLTNWQEVPDANEGEYSDGNSLIDYYFNNEKMPYILEGKGSEYNLTPEYLAIQARLRWRAYQLGYTFESFGEIDKKIAYCKHWDGYAKIERYADKYIEIAFQEYCGYLDSKNSFENYDDIGYLRTFKLKHDPTKIGQDIEIDSPNDRFLQRDFIDTSVSLDKWCNDKTTPDLTEYLQRESFQYRAGDWVLLHALVHQNHKSTERQFYFKVNAVLIRDVFLTDVRQAFTAETEFGRANNSIPYTQNIYKLEIPDGESIPFNEFTEWWYSVEKEIVEREYTKYVLLRDGVRLDEIEADMIWKSIISQLSIISFPRIHNANIDPPLIKFSTSDKAENITIEEALERMNLEVVVETFTCMEEVSVDKTIDVFIPVRYHEQRVYLCKNLIVSLNLSSPADSTDLYDEQGRLASFNYTYEVEYADQETFTYLRRDLLEKYLKDNHQTMFQVIWGERDYYPIDGDWTNNMRRTQERERATFYNAIEYKPSEGF